MALSDTAIRSAKPMDKPYKLADGGGLFLMVNPNGSRLWRLKYRMAGKEKLLSIGSYPAVSLAMARDARMEAKRKLASGIDPSEAKQAARREDAEAASNTFRIIATEYLDKIRREGRADATMAKLEWLLALAYPDLGDKPIRDLKAPVILEALRKIEARGTHETARRLRSTIGTVFRFAVATARADGDPTSALKGALINPKVKHHAAILDRTQLGGLMRAIAGFEGQPTTKAALELMALLVPRPGELRMARWQEFDLTKAIWTIPAERAKMRREHRVPLPARAIAILRDLNRLTGNAPYVFPSVRSVHRPMSENTLNAALRRLGYDKDEMTAHGFRSSFSTLANESGLWREDAIERQLSHEEQNDVRRAYARGEHWDERVRMMDWWADQLTSLRENSNALPI